MLPAAALVLAATAGAESNIDIRALSDEVEALKAGQQAIQKDLQEIKAFLRSAQAAPAQAPTRAAAAASPETVDLVLSVAGAPVKGDKSAKVTLVEFTDYQCPFCSRHFRQTWPQLERDYVGTGKVRLVLRDMPIEAIHPLAFKAAEATSCAAEQGKFWEMHDRLFTNQSQLARPDLSAHAQSLGLNVKLFDECLDSGKAAPNIRKDVADSAQAGAKGTPIFFLGLTQPGSSEFKAVRVIRGAHPYATFKEAIDGLLASAN